MIHFELMFVYGNPSGSYLKPFGVTGGQEGSIRGGKTGALKFNLKEKGRPVRSQRTFFPNFPNMKIWKILSMKIYSFCENTF